MSHQPHQLTTQDLLVLATTAAKGVWGCHNRARVDSAHCSLVVTVDNATGRVTRIVGCYIGEIRVTRAALEAHLLRHPTTAADVTGRTYRG